MSGAGPVIIKYPNGWVEVGELEGCWKLSEAEGGDMVYEHNVKINPVASRAYRAQLEGSK